jgi:drug/metabolite transporter (DMT)-like permease
MSARSAEPTVRDRLGERPALEAGKISKVRPRDLALRFAAGAVTSVVAGAMTLAFGARVGGILLAFPAILAASLTLIAKQEDSVDAREDARGAIVGGCALVIFAAVAAVSLHRVPGAVALLLAAVAWILVALFGYVGLWWRRAEK